MSAVSDRNERLIVLANKAIRSFTTGLRLQAVTTEPRDRALKLGEAFVTRDRPQCSFAFLLNASDTCQITVEVHEGSVRVHGQLTYPGGGSRLLRDGDRDACVVDRFGRLSSAPDQQIFNEIIYKMQRLRRNGLVRNSRPSALLAAA